MKAPQIRRSTLTQSKPIKLRSVRWWHRQVRRDAAKSLCSVLMSCVRSPRAPALKQHTSSHVLLSCQTAARTSHFKHSERLHTQQTHTQV